MWLFNSHTHETWQPCSLSLCHKYYTSTGLISICAKNLPLLIKFRLKTIHLSSLTGTSTLFTVKTWLQTLLCYSFGCWCTLHFHSPCGNLPILCVNFVLPLVVCVHCDSSSLSALSLHLNKMSWQMLKRSFSSPPLPNTAHRGSYDCL